MFPLEMKHDPSVGNRFPFKMSSVTISRNGYLVYPHWHEHLELIKIVGGPVLVTLGDETFYAYKDDIIYVNSRRIHSVKVMDNTVMPSLKGMIFDHLFVTNLLEGFETRQIYNLLIHSNQHDSLIRTSHPLWEELNDCMQIADNENAAKDIGYEMVIKSCIYRVVTAMLRHYKRNQHPIGDKFNLLRTALEYIEEKFAERLTITTLSRIANISESHFSRLFKQATGFTYTDYLTRTRINMAKQMLVSGQWTITQVSEKTGFCNVQYFGKVFKEATGLSPLQYKNDTIRKSFQDNP